MSGSKPLRDLADAQLELRYAGSTDPRLEAGAEFRLAVTLANRGEKPVQWSQEAALNAAFRWIDDHGVCIEPDGRRTRVPSRIEPGETVEFSIAGVTPAQTGQYQFIASLVLEGVHWACDIGDDGWFRIATHVIDAPEWPSDLQRSVGGRALRGALAAAALERTLEAVKFDPKRLTEVRQEPLPLHVPADAAPTVAAVQSPAPRPRAGIWKRVRAWLRHFFGVVELRSAVEELLRRSADSTGEVRAIRDEIAETGARQSAAVLALEHLAENQAKQALLLRDLGSQAVSERESLRAIGLNLVETVATWECMIIDQAKQIEELNKGLRRLASDQARAFASSDPSKGLAGIAKALSATAAKLDAHVVAQKAAMTEQAAGLTAAQGVLKGLEAASKSQRLAAAKHADELLQTKTLVNSVGAALASDRKIYGQDRVELQEIRKVLEAMGAIMEAQRDIVGQEGDELLEIRKLMGAMGATMEAQRDHFAQVEGVLTNQAAGIEEVKHVSGSLVTQVEAARGELSFQMSNGQAVGELLATLRQLAQRSVEVDYRTDLAAMRAGLEGLPALLGAQTAQIGSALGQVEKLSFFNSGKLDALLWRDTIPLIGASVVLARSRFGLLALDDSDVAAVAYYSSGELPEAGTVILVENLLRPGDCFMDVGANVGAYTLVAGRSVGPTGTVIAVEPVPATMALLTLTVAINGLGDIVEMHECALGAEPGHATMNLGVTNGHSSLLPVEGLEAGVVEVEIKTGAQLIRAKTPTLIKVDVEGWEIDALEGLRSIVDEPEVSVIVECSPTHIRLKGLTVAAWLKHLRTFGKKIWIIEPDGSLRPLTKASAVSNAGANLFLADSLPTALREVV